MSIIKSFSVGNGDTFYIKHGSDNFTVIDCCFDESNMEDIISEIIRESKNKRIFRFISTHPDDDHIKGLKQLDDRISILNFYCVENKVTKEDKSDDFDRYCELRDSENHFYIYSGCSRKWMNQNDNDRGSSGINILWPIVSNSDYKDALNKAENGESPNNICPIIKYSVEDGATVLWMGDLENDFLEKIKDKIDFPKVDILFAPHHGRKSGRVPTDILKILSPKIIVVGEAPSSDLEYYSKYDTITQNSAGDIIFECLKNKVRIYVGQDNYSVSFLAIEKSFNPSLEHYIGTLNL